MDALKRLFEQYYNTELERLEPVQGELGGSGRTIVRLSGGGQTAIGIGNSVREENLAFLTFSRHFRSHGLAVPEIYAEDLDHGVYLEEDLGDTTLFGFLNQNRQGQQLTAEAIEAYRKVLTELPRFQITAGRDLDYKVCYPRSSFDRQSINWDLNYFKYYFLRLAGIPFNEQLLEDDFDNLTQLLLAAPHDYFLYRDFQSRNVMLVDGKPWFLDYQGGRKGALQYDVASLLFDGKADLPPEVRTELLEHYLKTLATHIPVDRQSFLDSYYAYVYVRLMQAMGAYGFRGFYERKTHFLQSVPFALKNLRWLADHVKLPVAMPALMDALDRISTSEKLLSLAKTTKPLVVRVASFSYKKELPTDDSGNGGGFLFDARCLPNPGREEQYKQLTGKDAPVIEYLERHPAVHQYFANARALVDMAVANYRERGFQNLLVGFGCTGGQHRSVYLAEQTAKYLRSQGVEVRVEHIEQDKRVQDKRTLEKLGR